MAKDNESQRMDVGAIVTSMRDRGNDFPDVA